MTNIVSAVESDDGSNMVITHRKKIISSAFILLFITLLHIVSQYDRVTSCTHRELPCHRLIRHDNDDRLRQICQHLQTSPNMTSLTPDSRLTRTGYATPIDYVNCVASLSNCSRFRSELGYIDYVTKFELDFPLAFSLLTYENFEQTERLLRLVYRPHNVYCLHVDAKSPPEMHSAAETVASCLPNVIIARPAINVQWGRISVVEAEMSCMKILLEHNKDWKYFINLVGRDFPLKTNRELVEILKAYNGGNDVDGSRINQFFPEWFMKSWDSVDTPGKPKTFPPPHGVLITKGSTHMATTRAFVNFSLHDQRAKDLFDWMRDVRVPDEHFFQTLNYNPELGVPGAFKGNPDNYFKRSFARLKHWSSTFPPDVCAGEYIRYVCNIGIRDLPWVTSARHLFVNKIRLEQEPAAFHCLEQWYMDRVRLQIRKDPYGISATSGEITSFYASQLFARNHVGSEYRLKQVRLPLMFRRNHMLTERI